MAAPAATYRWRIPWSLTQVATFVVSQQSCSSVNHQSISQGADESPSSRLQRYFKNLTICPFVEEDIRTYGTFQIYVTQAAREQQPNIKR